MRSGARLVRGPSTCFQGYARCGNAAKQVHTSTHQGPKLAPFQWLANGVPARVPHRQRTCRPDSRQPTANLPPLQPTADSRQRTCHPYSRQPTADNESAAPTVNTRSHPTLASNHKCCKHGLQAWLAREASMSSYAPRPVAGRACLGVFSPSALHSERRCSSSTCITRHSPPPPPSYHPPPLPSTTPHHTSLTSHPPPTNQSFTPSPSRHHPYHPTPYPTTAAHPFPTLFQPSMMHASRSIQRCASHQQSTLSMRGRTGCHPVESELQSGLHPEVAAMQITQRVWLSRCDTDHAEGLGRRCGRDPQQANATSMHPVTR